MDSTNTFMLGVFVLLCVLYILRRRSRLRREGMR